MEPLRGGRSIDSPLYDYFFYKNLFEARKSGLRIDKTFYIDIYTPKGMQTKEFTYTPFKAFTNISSRVIYSTKEQTSLFIQSEKGVILKDYYTVESKSVFLLTGKFKTLDKIYLPGDEVFMESSKIHTFEILEDSAYYLTLFPGLRTTLYTVSLS